MTVGDWRDVMTGAASADTVAVQFMGGEPRPQASTLGGRHRA